MRRVRRIAAPYADELPDWAHVLNYFACIIPENFACHMFVEIEWKQPKQYRPFPEIKYGGGVGLVVASLLQVLSRRLLVARPD